VNRECCTLVSMRTRKNRCLQEYDYAQAGAYFVTLRVQGRMCLFGEVVDGEMRLNDAVRMVLGVWNALPRHYAGVEVDSFVVMPNHMHGIIILTNELEVPVGAGPRACPSSGHSGRPRGAAPTTMTLGNVVHRFKSLTTAKYRRGVNEQDWSPFPGRLWQRNYYEHVIRNASDLFNARRYICNNPMRWDLDEENLRASCVR
jgi:REP element-mobilizing transposase RayT